MLHRYRCFATLQNLIGEQANKRVQSAILEKRHRDRDKASHHKSERD